ncbi:thiopurine S-methyltransferase [Pseudomonas benzenivorans]|nr:thiopurine S-methyltransferase [Pseudomonas benzenivorans]
MAQLRLLLPNASPVFLLTIEDAEEHASLQQALGVDPELQALYAADFDIDLAHVESLFETDPHAPEQPARRAEYKVYRLSGRTQER